MTFSHSNAALNLSNCRGVIPVVSSRKNYAPVRHTSSSVLRPSQSRCPLCGSADFAYRAKTQQITCRAPSCSKVSTLSPTEGVDALVGATMALLPELACIAFLHAQSHSEAERLRMAAKVIANCVSSANASENLASDMVRAFLVAVQFELSDVSFDCDCLGC